jgi:hypothetical protein
MPDEIDDADPDERFDENEHPFKGSYSWLHRFMDKDGLSLWSYYGQRPAKRYLLWLSESNRGYSLLLVWDLSSLNCDSDVSWLAQTLGIRLGLVLLDVTEWSHSGPPTVQHSAETGKGSVWLVQPGLKNQLFQERTIH